MTTSLCEDLVLHQVSPSVVEKDIPTVLQYELGEIRCERNLPADWPGEPEVGILVHKANCLYISVVYGKFLPKPGCPIFF